MLNKKSINHFLQVADTFDLLLNDAVDLHVQVIGNTSKRYPLGMYMCQMC